MADKHTITLEEFKAKYQEDIDQLTSIALKVAENKARLEPIEAKYESMLVTGCADPFSEFGVLSETEVYKKLHSIRLLRAKSLFADKEYREAYASFLQKILPDVEAMEEQRNKEYENLYRESYIELMAAKEKFAKKVDEARAKKQNEINAITDLIRSAYLTGLEASKPLSGYKDGYLYNFTDGITLDSSGAAQMLTSQIENLRDYNFK